MMLEVVLVLSVVNVVLGAIGVYQRERVIRLHERNGRD
jgi:NADH:ubiquinone oxidoreductase subunit K